MAKPLAPRKNRILLIDRHVCFTNALALVLLDARYQAQQLPIPAELGSALHLFRAVVDQKPEIVLLDPNLGNGSDGIDLIKPLTRRGIDVVVLTGSDDRARWGQAVEQGACAVVSKTQPLDDVLILLRRIQRGQEVLANGERKAMLAVWHEKDHRYRMLAGLTPRERSVLAQLMEGRHVLDIMATHHVTEATVRSQVKQIMAKTGTRSQMTLVCLAYQLGWTPHLELPDAGSRV